MGDFLLMMAKERANEQGVHAEAINRKGRVREQIKKVAVEKEVSLIILGRPCGDDSTFRLAELKKYTGEIEAETGIKTEIV
jgi:hypothetical protein